MSTYIVVSAAGRRRLVPIDDIVEIVPMLAVEEVEGRRGACRGAVNLRGAIVPLFDLTGPDAPLSPSRFILVARADGQVIGLIVDDVHDVVGIPDEQLATRPVGGGHKARMANVDGSLLVIVKPSESMRDVA